MTEDAYVAVDEVAERLGLPLGVLVRRVQAGDVPARRIDGPDGPRYELRLSDLGIEPAYTFEPTTVARAYEDERDTVRYGDLEVELAGTTTPEPNPDQGYGKIEFQAYSATADTQPATQAEPAAAGIAVQDPEWPSAIAQPEWLSQTAKTLSYETTDVVAPPSWNVSNEPTGPETVAAAPAPAPEQQPEVAQTYPSDDVTAAVPPPRTETNPSVSLVDYTQAGPLAEIAAMSIDPRELVAGLLDRWERTLEQRIYAEQRQRFEAELNARQTLVKELQLELKSAHAEKAATQSESARIIAERERQLRDRDLELMGLQTELDRAVRRKRGWFFRR